MNRVTATAQMLILYKSEYFLKHILPSPWQDSPHNYDLNTFLASQYIAVTKEGLLPSKQ